ncbi:VaFE repeat-containing surface-anchored protein [uncultured Varibaculum sp.]|uniref:VaFE repeat-containing surface-anchored protein n=1 Tax=uncultured Varibaculum sp. TaxID=413896 RepID=UPI00117CE491|nr:VaFE repeat-containing surface-anchored protein [uncultured Varibaculum sp.]
MMINSQTAKLLRRWIVAGLAAALALAWTITTLVAPSQASTDENVTVDAVSGTPTSLNLKYPDSDNAGRFPYPGAYTAVESWRNNNPQVYQEWQQRINDSYGGSADTPVEYRYMTVEEPFRDVQGQWRYKWVDPLGYFLPNAGPGKNQVITESACIDPNVGQDPIYTTYVKNLSKNAVQTRITLDPQKAIEYQKKAGKNYSPEQQGMFKALAYVNTGGDPRLNDFVNYDDATLKQKIAEYPAIGDFYNANMALIEAQRDAVAKIKSLKPNQKYQVLQGLAWAINRGNTDWLAIGDNCTYIDQYKTANCQVNKELTQLAHDVYADLKVMASSELKMYEAYAKYKEQFKNKRDEYEKALKKWQEETQRQVEANEKLYQTNKELLSSIKIYVDKTDDGKKLAIKLHGSSEALALLQQSKTNIDVNLTVNGKTVPVNGVSVAAAASPEGIPVPVDSTGLGCDQKLAGTVTASFSGEIEISGTYIFDGRNKLQRQVVLQKYKVAVSGNTSHDFSFAGTCPVAPERKIGTTLEGSDGAKVIDTAGKKRTEKVTLVDKVKFENLKGGQNYVIKGELVDGNGNGVGVTGTSETFDPKASGATDNGNGYYSGTINMTFQVPVQTIRDNQKLVAFETLYQGDRPETGTKVTEHKDKNDENQTVTEKPRIGTSAEAQGESSDDGKVAVPEEGKDVLIKDTVTWNKLKPGTYTLSGQLMKKVGNQVVPVAGTKAAKNFTVNTGQLEGTQELTFTLPAKQIEAGASYVVYEKVFKGANNTAGILVASHEDPNDKGQTVTVNPKQHKLPTIKTVAWVRDDGNSLISTVEADGKDFKVKDKIIYNDLKPGTYTAFATLVNKDNPKEIIASGRQVFTNGAENGSTLVELAVAGSKVKADGKYVVFERIYQGEQTSEPSGEPYAKHQEIGDKSQTITVAPKNPVPAEFKIVKKTVGDNANTDRVFDFDVACDGYTGTVSVVVRKGQTQGETKVSNSALTSGMSCQVSEQAVQDDQNTVKVQFSGTDTNSDGTVAKFNLTENNAKTVVVTATNTFTPKQAKFTVRKNVEAAGVTHFSVPNSFDFSYKCDGDAYWKAIPTLKAGETSAAIKVKPGVECQVKENSGTPENLDRTLEWLGAQSQAGGTATFRTDANNTVALVATNTYTEKTGQLEISKQVVDGTAGAGTIPGTFEMKYICATGQKAESVTKKLTSISVNKGGSATITGIPVGSQCAVYEDTTGINVPNTTLTTTFNGKAPQQVTIGGQVLHNAALSNPIKAGESQKATINVENKYVNQKAGGFEVEKLVAGVTNPGTVLKDVAFDFGYSCEIPGNAHAVKGSFKLKHGETFTSADPANPQLNNLPVNTVCKVWEETPKSSANADYVGSELRASATNGAEVTGTDGKLELTIKLNKAAAKAKILATNQYSQQLGGFTLKKEVQGSADQALDIQSYKFKLTYMDGTNTHVKEQTIPAGGGSYSFWGVPVGSQVQVEELGAVDSQGNLIPVNELSTAKVKHSISWNGTQDDSSTASANIFTINKAMTEAQWKESGKQANVVVKATNTYKAIEQKGTFSVQKTAVKVAGESKDKVKNLPTSYNFTYDCSDGIHGNIPNVKPGGEPVVAPAQFRAGTVCTLTEQQVLPKGTNAQTVSWTVDGKGKGVGPAAGTSATVTIGSDAKHPVAVQAANEYQTPDEPKIATELKGEGRNGNIDLVEGADHTYTLTDKISYWNLEVGKTYKFSGELVVPNADKTDATRTGIKAEKTVTITTPSGVVELPFKLTQADVAKYSTLVAFEKLDLQVEGGFEPVTKHEDPKDENQTKQVNPWIATVLTDEGGNKQIDTTGKADSELVTLVDTVKYRNLEAGKTYHLTGKLVDGSGKPIGVSSTSKAFTVPGEAGTLQSGEAKMTFQVTVGQIRQNAKLVAFEYLHPGQPNTPGDETVITKHEDPNDENQTVNEGPRAATTAQSSTGTKVFDAKTPAKVLDRVTWSKLPAGNYVLVGTLMDKGTKQAVPNVNAEIVKFTVSNGELKGLQEMTFTVPAEQAKSNAQFVAFEKIYRQGDVDENGNVKDGKKPVVEHSDLNDKAQTVTTGEEPQSPVTPTLTLQKVVKSEGLEVPSTKQFAFTLKCSSPIDGKSKQQTYQVTAGSKISLPYVKGANCTLTEDREGAKVAGIAPSQVTFSADSEKIGLITSDNSASFKMPAEETTEVNVVLTATNTYPAPEKPTVATSAKDANGTKGMYGQSKQANQVYAGTSAKIVDEVSWANLLPGDYVLIGKLMDKETGKAVTSYTSTPAPFTVKAGEKNGKLDNTFTVSGDSLKAGSHYVVYEYIYRAGDVNGATPNNGAKPVVEHAVITDADQTVEAITPPTPPAAKVKIMKKVVASGMEVSNNRAYIFTLSCRDKDGNAAGDKTLLVRPDKATEVTGLRSGYVCSINEDLDAAIEQQVTPSISLTSGTNGFSVQQDSTAGAAHFTVPAATEQVPEVLVNVTNTYNKMGKPELQTNAVTDNGSSSVQAGTATTVTDKVTWKNLPEGKYLLTGKLMHITDDNAAPVAGVTNEPVVLEITKDNSLAGSTTMKFNVPAGAISQAGKYVVYEYLYNYEDTDGHKPKPNTSTVVSHNDPSDDAQTVNVTEAPSVSTTATTDGANEKEIQKGKAAVVTDTVNWKNLPAGNYQALSELVDSKGNPVAGATTKAVPFTVNNGEEAGSVKTKIQLPATATSTAGAKFVVFERIYRASDVDSQTGRPAQNAQPVVSELDLNAINQTVRVVESPKGPPAITFTKVTEKALDGQVPDKDRKFQFTISCDKNFGGAYSFEMPAGVSAALPADKQLQAGTVCTLTEMLTDEANADGILPDAISFSSSNKAMAVSKINNQTAQFTVPDVDTKVVPEIQVTIKNIYSKDFPELGTIARDNADQDKVLDLKKGENAQVQDVATWKNLAPGKYTMMGTLMDKLTGKPVVGANTPAVDFQVKKGEKTGTIYALFTVPGDKVSTKASWVVFEKVYKASDVKDGKVVSKATPVVDHSNLEDADQTVQVTPPPASQEQKTREIATVAKNGTTFNDGTKDPNLGKPVLTPGQDAVIVDTVKWKNLEPGEYTITGSLMDKSTNAPLTYLDKDGNQKDGATAERGSFAVKEGQTEGETKVYFTVKGEAIQANRQYVVFEDLYKTADIDEHGQPTPGAEKVAQHHDINDAAQTLSGDKPKPGTPPETPKTPNTPGTTPPGPTPRTPSGFRGVVSTVLAKTGSTTGIMAMTGVLAMVAGIGLVMIRRYQREELED